ncbi:MAG: ArnT family glycosyltransferase, partial [Anaerolineales bacterium]
MRVKAVDGWAVSGLLLFSTFAFVKLRAPPPFTDEAAHMWWVQRALEAGDWLRPLNAGKPLEQWLAAPFVRLAGGDPLTVMRGLHVVAGMFSVMMVYLLASRLADRRIAFLSAGLIALCPFVVYLERQAQAEIYLCAASLLVLLGVLW